MQAMVGEEPRFPGAPQNQLERQPQHQYFGGKMSHVNTRLQETYLAHLQQGWLSRNASHGRLALPGVGPPHHKGGAGGSDLLVVHPRGASLPSEPHAEAVRLLQ